MAIVGLDYVDTSGEVSNQKAAHQRRLQAFAKALQRDLAASGRYRFVPISCGAEPCSSRMNPFELQKAAHAAGAKLVLIGGIHKMSTLIQWAKIQIIDEDQGHVVFDRLLTFRGDTDEAWQKAEGFVAGEILAHLQAHGAAVDLSADPPSKIRIAVFPFELDDFSAAGRAGSAPVETSYLAQSTEEAREQLLKSGRYRLVDTTVNAKDRPLRDCSGCAAAIAKTLGADQALRGEITKISMTEYVVNIEISDAQNGKILSRYTTSLRIGADYSWPRGVRWLMQRRVLASK